MSTATSLIADLYAEHARRVLATARGLVGAQDAEDLAQEVWVRTIRGWSGFRGDAAVSSWLHRIAVNCMLDRHRRRRITTLPLDVRQHDHASRDRPVDDRLVAHEASAALVALLSRLPPAQRAALQSFALDESGAGGAARLGLTVAQRHGRIWRIIAKLRQQQARRTRCGRG